MAGESMCFKTGKLKLNMLISEVGAKAVCEEFIKQVSSSTKDTMFSMMVHCGNLVQITGYYSYGNGFIKVESYNKNHLESFSISGNVLK